MIMDLGRPTKLLNVGPARVCVRRRVERHCRCHCRSQCKNTTSSVFVVEIRGCSSLSLSLTECVWIVNLVCESIVNYRCCLNASPEQFVNVLFSGVCDVFRGVPV